MDLSRHDAWVKADEYERLAAAAPSGVLRCRYQSFARYWSILAEDTSDFVEPRPANDRQLVQRERGRSH